MVLHNKKVQTKGYKSEEGKKYLLLIWGLKDDIVEDMECELGLKVQ